MRTNSTFLLAVFLPLLLMNIDPPPIMASEGGQGLQDGWAIDNSCQVLFSAELAAKMREAGSEWVRINFRLGSFTSWEEVETCSGVSALDLYDQVVQNALDNGLGVLALLSNESWPGEQSAWQENNAEMSGGDGDNSYLSDFSTMAAVPLSQHFSGRISTWEVWNEPNAYTDYSILTGYTGGSFIYPSNFAWLLHHVYEDVREAGVTGVQFVSGGVFGHDLGGLASLVEGRIVTKRGDPISPAYGRDRENGRQELKGARPPKSSDTLTSGSEYLRATYEQGKAIAGWDEIRAATGSFPLDGVGQHLYIDQGGTTSARKISSYLRDVRGAYVAYEGKRTTKETYVTEVGWATDRVTEAIQAQNLEIAYGQFSATTYCHTAYWFQIRDIAAADLYYGLLTPFDPPWIAKQSWDAYQLAAVN